MEKRKVMKNMVKMKVHAGGGWEGHIVFTAINPFNEEDQHMSSNLEEVKAFCEKRNLVMNENFMALVSKHLSFSQDSGIVIPVAEIDDNRPITSATNFLKKYFADFY